MKDLVLVAVTAVVVGAAFGAAHAAPEVVYNQTRSEAIVIDRAAPCASEVVKRATKPEYKAKLFAAVYLNRANGQHVRGCGAEVGGVVHLLFEDGDFMSIPAAQFESARDVKPMRDKSERRI